MNNITVTVIFEGSALNRNENLAGNIQSIKKLTYLNDQYSYISKYAMRHYLFNTLLRAYEEDWKEAGLTVQNEVIQFDIFKDDIFTSAELDAFGYMYTISKEGALTRKAPTGITKAISITPYRGDIAFYANHDLVRRAIEQGDYATPNPAQKEEHLSFYKMSFTIDAKFFGQDSFIVDSYKYANRTLKVYLVDRKGIVFDKVSYSGKNLMGAEVYKVDGKDDVIIEDGIVRVSKELVKVSGKGSITLGFKEKEENGSSEETGEQEKNNKKGGKSKGKQNKKDEGVELPSVFYRIEGDYYVFDLVHYKFDKDKKELNIYVSIAKVFEDVEEKDGVYVFKDLGHIGFTNLGSKYRMDVFLREDLKKRRVRQLLEAIHNGLMAQSSGELNTIVPLFLIAAPVRIPSPVFHPYVHLDFSGDKPVVRGLKDCLKNRWLVDKPYVYVSERLMANLNESEIYQNWDEFLKVCGLE